jgi:hypothetical protein
VGRIKTAESIIPTAEQFISPLAQAYDILNDVDMKYYNRRKERLDELALAWQAAAHASQLNHIFQRDLELLFDPDPPPLDRTQATDIIPRLGTLEYIAPLLGHLYSAKSERRFFTTATSRYGLGRKDIRSGDLVCVLWGGRDCYILRQAGEYYFFVGNCYCDGFMLSEAVANLEKWNLTSPVPKVRVFRELCIQSQNKKKSNFKILVIE